jgi:hypothetical protein
MVSLIVNKIGISEEHLEVLSYLGAGSVLLSLDKRLEHSLDGNLRVFTDGLLSKVHLAMGCILNDLPSQILIIDSRWRGVITIPPLSRDDFLSFV